MKDISNEKEFFKNSQKFNDFDYIKRLDFFFWNFVTDAFA